MQHQAKFKTASLSLLVSLIVIVANTSPANAATDTVSILPTIMSRCGDQKTYVTGTATYAQVVNRDLVVKLDDTVVYYTPRYVRPTTWTTGLFDVTSGQHTITAYIYRDGAHTSAAATATQTIEVRTCSDHPGSSGGGGKGEPAIPAKVQKVMNDVPAIFKSIFKKKINKAETTFWKNRAIGKGEKYTVKDLKKEMLAYQKTGRTMPQVLKVIKGGIKVITAGKESSLQSFKPLVKESRVIAGQKINLNWNTSKDNRSKFPMERIYICTTANTPKCSAVVATTPNDGKESIKVSVAPGTYRFALQALNNEGALVAGIRSSSNAFKVLAK
jgi:hypothetical protein